MPSRSVRKAAECGATDPRVVPIEVKHLNNDEAFTLLMDKQTQEFVLRDSVIQAFNNCLPITRHPKHLRRLVTQSTICASYKSDGNTVSGVSYSTVVPAPCGVISNIYIHVFDHVDFALAHLTQHLAHTACVVPEQLKVGFRIIFPADIDKEVVKEFLLPHFGQTKVSKVHPVEYVITATAKL